MMKTEQTTSPIHAYKGFDADLTCRGFQFAEGETFEQDKPAKLCATGFHAVTTPLDVFGYYPPGTSIYHQVTLEGVDGKRESDSKIAGRKITIGAYIGIPGLVKAHVKFVMDNVGKDAQKGAHLTGDRSAASNTGYQSAASVTGKESIAIVTGKDSKASGALGCWIVLTERDNNWAIVTVKAVKVDGTKVKAEVFYTLRNGKVVQS